MRGIVYKADRDMQVETVPDAAIEDPKDAVIRVTKAAICGSDLHIYNHGEAFGFCDGNRCGHEFVGVVEEVGAEVSGLSVGDKVLSPFWISCGACHFCAKGLHTSCVNGGPYGFAPFWAHGGEIQGGQSEYVRVPHATGTLDVIPESLADEAGDLKTLPMTDVFGTGYHAAVCGDIQPGDTVYVIGDGAVGLSAAHAATLFEPENIVVAGHHDDRLAIAETMGATHTINTSRDDAAELLAGLTDGRGPQAVLATISSPETMAFAAEQIEPGKSVAWVGMEVFLGAPEIPWDKAFFKNVGVRGGVAPVKTYLPTLWPLLESGKIDPSPVLTHDMSLEDAAAGYEVMASRQEGSVKVAITPGA